MGSGGTVGGGGRVEATGRAGTGLDVLLHCEAHLLRVVGHQGGHFIAKLEVEHC